MNKDISELIEKYRESFLIFLNEMGQIDEDTETMVFANLKPELENLFNHIFDLDEAVERYIEEIQE